MTGRRRYPRFLLAAPAEGALHVREEVTIETWNDGEIQAVSTIPCPVTEGLVLELAGDGVRHLAVIVREIRPFVTADGSIRYRLRLGLDQANETGSPDEGKLQL